jgi:hypothetical protein
MALARHRHGNPLACRTGLNSVSHDLAPQARTRRAPPREALDRCGAAPVGEAGDEKDDAAESAEQTAEPRAYLAALNARRCTSPRTKERRRHHRRGARATCDGLILTETAGRVSINLNTQLPYVFSQSYDSQAKTQDFCQQDLSLFTHLLSTSSPLLTSLRLSTPFVADFRLFSASFSALTYY